MTDTAKTEKPKKDSAMAKLEKMLKENFAGYKD